VNKDYQKLFLPNHQNEATTSSLVEWLCTV